MNCEFCEGKGWAVTYGYGSNDESKNGLHIERCDECDIFKSDYAALVAAVGSEVIVNKVEAA